MPSYQFNLLHKGDCERSITERTYTDYYRLIVSEPITRVEVLAYLNTAQGIEPGITYADDPDATLRRIKPDLSAEDGRSYMISLEYSTASSGGISYADPLDRPWEIEWDQDVVDEPIAWDYSTPAKTFVNSAGEPFDNQPTRAKGYGTCRLTRNESTSDFYSITLPVLLLDTVINSDAFDIREQEIPALHARLNIRAIEMVEQGFTYYRVTYLFSFRRGVPGYTSDGWRDRFEDRGRMGGTSGQWVSWLDADGRPVQKPVPMDGAGGRMANDSDEGAALPAFKMNPEIAFSVFAFE